MTTRSFRGALTCALLASTAVSAPALATSPFLVTERQAPDANGIDVISGKASVPLQTITAGRPDQDGLTYAYGYAGGQYFDTFAVSIIAPGGTGTLSHVTAFGKTESFTLNADGSYTSIDANGSTLSYNSTAAAYTYTQRDGTVFTFLKSLGDSGYGAIVTARLATVKKPNGDVWTYTWTVSQGAPACVNLTCGPTFPEARVESITSNLGYQLKAAYQSDTFVRPGGASNAAWTNLVSVTAINNAVDYCQPVGPCSGLTQTWPKLVISHSTSGSTTTNSFTDNLNRTVKVGTTSAGPVSVQNPASSSTDTSMTYDTNNRVASFSQGGGTWNYTYSDSGTQRTTTVTQPLGGSKIYVSDLNLNRVLSETDELGRITNFSYDSNGRLLQETLPEQNGVAFTYDGRGNVVTQTRIAKPSSGLTNTSQSASFPSTCSNPVTCNEPTSITDARGNTTSYMYDPTHGGVLSVTSPAPVAGAVQPQVRYSYSPLSAYYKNSSGVITQAATPVYKVTAISTCMTQASCAGTADEVKTTIGYGSTGVANNLLAVSISKGSGDGALTATTAYGYDAASNLTSVDGPLAGAADTTTYFYDTTQHLTGIASANPGVGSLPNRAIQYTYDGNGLLSRVDQGTITQSGSTWSAVTVRQSLNVTRDNLGRPVAETLTSGPPGAQVIQAAQQLAYDAKGRVDCTAVRMNSAVFSSLPSSACSLGSQGSAGPDRITKNVYDNADELTQQRAGYGTAEEAADESFGYTNNGLVGSITDGENNKTTYVFDGFDRLSEMQYPNATKGSGASSSTDHEQLGYDATDNVVSRTLRDASSITFAFDALNRVTGKTLPSGEPAVTYSYDNLGDITSASQSGNALSFTYDQLERNLTQTGPEGTVTSHWDLAGDRTEITYPGTGLYINYDYLPTGDLSGIRENGASSGVGVLASYAYDDIGRRSSVTFGNGVVQAFTYDPASRLASLSNDLNGTVNDLNATFSYNPSGQISSVTRSGDAYAWTGHGSGSTSYVSNGLNQLTSVAGATANWDSKGNLTTEPQSGKTYGYSSENLLTSASGGVTLGYDPAERLFQVAGSTTTRFAYDGANDIAEYNGSDALQRRFVFDDRGQPVLWYEGSGTTDRRFLSADERGSIISLTDSSGGLLNTNTYDEYGKPGAANAGRFQYTGQKWIPEAGLYDDQARNYLPQLGIFAQGDPTGQADNPNVYSYVDADPINFVDPTGMAKGCPPASGIVICGKRKKPDPKPVLPTIGGAATGGATAPGGGTGTRIVIIGKRAIVIRAKKSTQCVSASGWQGAVEDAAQFGANLSDNIATIAALTGQEEIAAPLEGLSWGFTLVRAGSQALRHDSTGAYVTLSSAAASTLIGKANRLLPIGGAAQKKLNGAVATGLGWATGKGLDMVSTCE